MVRTSSALVLLLALSACGGATPSATTTAVATTLAPAACPSGEIPSQGDGPAYLNIGGSHEIATAGQIPDDVPVFLGAAVEAIPQELMVGLGYTGCTSLGGASNFEEMAWTNGIGLLLISWHEWPKVSDPSTAPFGGVASQAGVVQVSRIETGTEDLRMRVVRLFDGLKVVSVSTYGLTTMGIDQVEEVGWAVYDGLPIDMNGAEVEGTTVSEVLARVRSDQRTVSEPAAFDGISPFTLRAGAAHTSYSAVIDGTDVLLYDFGVPQVARRAAELISDDGYTIAHQPYEWSGQPHVWLLGRVILLYQGGSESFVAFLTEELGPPVAGAVSE